MVVDFYITYTQHIKNSIFISITNQFIIIYIYNKYMYVMYLGNYIYHLLFIIIIIITRKLENFK